MLKQKVAVVAHYLANMKNNKITQTVTASAPGKLMVGGDHAVVYGYPCLVIAVDQRVQVTVSTRLDEPAFYLYAPELGLEAYHKSYRELGSGKIPVAARFIEQLINIIKQEYPDLPGLDITTHSQFSCQVGFGSSSAVTVATGKAISIVCDLGWSDFELFDRCYRAVLAVQGVGSGFDIAAAIWGQLLRYARPNQQNPTKPGELVLVAQESPPFIVGYTGIKADTPTIIREVALLKQQQPALVQAVFETLTNQVQAAETAIQTKNWSKLGECLNNSQAALNQLGVSSPELDALIGAALKAGAYGAKLSGAGRGDCMIAVVEKSKRQQVAAAITQAGGQVLEVKLGGPGVKT